MQKFKQDFALHHKSSMHPPNPYIRDEASTGITYSNCKLHQKCFRQTKTGKNLYVFLTLVYNRVLK